MSAGGREERRRLNAPILTREAPGENPGNAACYQVTRDHSRGGKDEELDKEENRTRTMVWGLTAGEMLGFHLHKRREMLSPFFKKRYISTPEERKKETVTQSTP